MLYTITYVLKRAQLVAFNSFVSQKNTSTSDVFYMEATLGIEPRNKGVADLCLTAWLCRHIYF